LSLADLREHRGDVALVLGGAIGLDLVADHHSFHAVTPCDSEEREDAARGLWLERTRRGKLRHRGQESSHSMRSIPVGAKGSFSLVVARDHLANRFKDAMLPPVLATPVMIMMMENAALNAIKPYLDEGDSAVGVHVDVVHHAATAEGIRVTASAEVTKVDGPRIDFRIEATDGTQVIGTGTHERRVINLAKFSERLKRAGE
jgi:fluoroacetyl-CoA thioesterase